jgi:site-specific recombinase XerD
LASIKAERQAEPRPTAGARHEQTLEGVGCSGVLRLSKNPESPETWIHKPLIFHDRTLRKNQQLGFFDSLISQAGHAAGLTKRISCHTFRYSFATHLLQQAYDIRTVQELLGHQDVKTTMMYTHVLNRGRLAVRSPLD